LASLIFSPFDFMFPFSAINPWFDIRLSLIVLCLNPASLAAWNGETHFSGHFPYQALFASLIAPFPHEPVPVFRS
jgi:hypothetical protein